MKTIVWTFLTLTILAAMSAPAAAFDVTEFFETFFEAQVRVSR